MYLKQSTASQSRMVGPFVDDTDFKSLETALTIANTDVKLSKNGAAGVNKNSGGGTHRDNGMYSLTFDATDTDTVGELEVSIKVTGALVVFAKFFVLEEVIYDALFAASAAALPAAAPGASGGLVVVGANAAATSFTAGLTISNAGGSALTLTSSGSNGSGLIAQGNGTGSGISGTGGATGAGIAGVGGSTSGIGISGTGSAGNSAGIAGIGQGTAAGVRGTGGATGRGIHGQGGSTSGVGIEGTGTAGNSVGILGTGQGSAAGVRGTGGATGRGILGVGGATSGAGIEGQGTAGNSAGILGAGQGSAAGLRAVGGATGNGISAVGGATSGHGIQATVTSGNEIDADLVGNITGNLSGSVGSVTGAVGSVTGSVGSLGATAKADVNAEVDTALADVNLDHLVGTATGIPAVPAGTFLDQIMDDGTATFDRTTDSLQAIADSGGGGPTAAQIADAVWDEAQSGHTTAGTFGKFLDTEVSGVGGGSNPTVLQSTTITNLATQQEFDLSAGSTDDNAYLGAQVIITDQVTAAQQSIRNITAYTGATRTVSLDEAPAFAIANGDLISVVAARADTQLIDSGASASAIASAVYGASTSEHTTGGSFGLLFNDIEDDTADMQPKFGTITDLGGGATIGANLADLDTGVTAVPTAAANADAVWDEDATAHQTLGTFGQAIGDPVANTETIYDAVVTDAAGTNVAADIIAVKAETANILTDTAEIGAAGAGLTEAGGTGDHLTAIDLPNQTMDITGNLSGSVGSVTGAVGSVTAGVTLAANAVSAAALAADAANEIADAILSRDIDNVEGTAALHSLCSAVLKAVARVRDNAGVLETYRTDGTTLHMSQTVTVDATLDPVDELSTGT